MEKGASAEVGLCAAQDRAVLVAIVADTGSVTADISRCSPSLLLNPDWGQYFNAAIELPQVPELTIMVRSESLW
jgi:hypothetical protein